MLAQTCTLLIFFLIYWLCFVPFIVCLAIECGILQPQTTDQFVCQYGGLFLILCIVYVILRSLMENCYTKYEIRSRLRRLCLRQQLEKLERGEVQTAQAWAGSADEWSKRLKKIENIVEVNLKKMIESDLNMHKGNGL